MSTTAWNYEPTNPITPPNLRGAWASVNVAQLHKNVAILKAHASSSQLMAIVKANAYGHGAAPMGQHFLQAGADRLGVSTILEAIELRKAGITAPILVLSEVPRSVVPFMVNYDLTPTLFTKALMDAFVAEMDKQGRDSYPVHIKVDTGMGRIGVSAEDLEDVAKYLKAHPQLHVEGIFSHFACADEEDPAITECQYARFDRALAVFAKAGIHPELVHISNSAAMLSFPDYHLDLVRPGLALYGYSPAPHIDGLGIKPVLAVTGLLMQVKRVRAGWAISYGHTWTAGRDTVIGTVPIGYADGLPRALSNRGEVWVNGRRVPIVGRVCMDLLMVDLGHDAQDAVGDQVWLLGGHDDAPTAEDWGTWSDTIHYEILTNLNARLERVFT